MIVTEIVPRVSETDGAGHINNVVVPVWFEAGRREIFRILNPDLGFADWHAVLASIQVDYLAQIFFQRHVEVRTRVEAIGNKSFTLGEEIWQDERCCSRGRAVYVYFDFAAQCSRPLPAEVRAALAGLQPGD